MTNTEKMDKLLKGPLGPDEPKPYMPPEVLVAADMIRLRMRGLLDREGPVRTIFPTVGQEDECA
ncbi:MAG: hypothetical protein HN396_18625 [Gemmatimonadales bacterium]|jgi:hypothetical protein|nr:hypothetical protein [Gemmatimonadales bacterium]